MNPSRAPYYFFKKKERKGGREGGRQAGRQSGRQAGRPGQYENVVLYEIK